MVGYEDILKNCIKQKKQVSIERAEIDDEPIAAIPVKASEQLLLLHYLYDFYLDGFKVLRMADITDIVRGDVEIFHDEIISKEGMTDLLCTPDISIDSWKIFFNVISKEDRLIDISLEEMDDGTSFFVGKVSRAEQEFLELVEIDALGNYHEQATRISYQDITLVSFGNRYSELLDKYS